MLLPRACPQCLRLLHGRHPCPVCLLDSVSLQELPTERALEALRRGGVETQGPPLGRPRTPAGAR